MTDTSDHHDRAHVVVHPVVRAGRPYRGVDILGVPAGRAHSFADLADIVHRAGLPDLDLRAPGNVQWQGGDSHQWG